MPSEGLSCFLSDIISKNTIEKVLKFAKKTVKSVRSASEFERSKNVTIKEIYQNSGFLDSPSCSRRERESCFATVLNLCKSVYYSNADRQKSGNRRPSTFGDRLDLLHESMFLPIYPNDTPTISIPLQQNFSRMTVTMTIQFNGAKLRRKSSV